ncbi:hypothetical protein ACI65C_009417 [Semiaphis heraclei]
MVVDSLKPVTGDWRVIPRKTESVTDSGNGRRKRHCLVSPSWRVPDSRPVWHAAAAFSPQPGAELDRRPQPPLPQSAKAPRHHHLHRSFNITRHHYTSMCGSGCPSLHLIENAIFLVLSPKGQ